MDKIRVMLVDDHPAMRLGVRVLLEMESDIEVVAEADSRVKAIAAIEEKAPDVLLLDIQLREENGLDLMREVLEKQPEFRVLLLSAFDEEAYIVDAMLAGAAGYLHKSDCAAHIVNAVRSVHAGERYLDARHTAALISGFAARKSQESSADLVGLTARERELLAHLADGESIQQISDEMYISVSTVKRMTDVVVQKLGARNKTQAVYFAMKAGLL